MSKSPQVPATPNPQAVGAAQTSSNIDTQIGNMVGTSGPSGSTSYKQTGSYTDPNTGQVIPQFTENTSLTPLGQSIYTGTQTAANSLTGTAGVLANDAANSATVPLNVSGVNNNTIQAGPQALDAPVAQAAYNASTNFLTPTFNQQQTDLQDQLARQGIPVGSDAYGNAENQLQNTQNSALVGAANNATVTGANQANQLYNLALLGQNQQLGQQQTLQSNPLNLISQIYGGANSPTAVA